MGQILKNIKKVSGLLEKQSTEVKEIDLLEKSLFDKQIDAIFENESLQKKRPEQLCSQKS